VQFAFRQFLVAGAVVLFIWGGAFWPRFELAALPHRLDHVIYSWRCSRSRHLRACNYATLRLPRPQVMAIPI